MTDRFSLFTLFAEGEGPGFQALLMPMVARAAGVSDPRTTRMSMGPTSAMPAPHGAL